MKRLIMALLFAGALFTGGAWFSGDLAEQRYQALLQNNPFSDVVLLHAVRYERGLLSSTVVTGVEVVEPRVVAAYAGYQRERGGRDDLPALFEVESRVHHGPLWFDEGIGIGVAHIDSHLVLDRAVRERLAAVVEGEPLSMRTHVGFGATADVALDTSKITFDERHNGGSVVVHPVRSNWQLSDAGHRIVGEMNWPGLEVAGDQATIRVSSAVFKTDIARHRGLWIGDSSWDQEAISFVQPGKKGAVRQLHIDAGSRTDADGELLAVDINATMQSADLDGASYGPGVYRMSMTNLPVDTLARLQQLQDQMMRATLHGVAGQASSTMAMQVMMMLPELFGQAPVIEIGEMRLATPHGDLQGRLNISLPEIAPEMMMNFPYLKRVLRADADLTVPAAWLSDPKAAQAAYNFIQSGFIEQREGLLHTTLHMADGALLVNGKAVPLPF